MRINKTTTIGAPAPLSEAELDKAAEQAGRALKDGAKVTVRIPAAVGQLECCVNGHNLIIRAGGDVTVPAVVGQLVEEYLKSIGY